jgi:hypothetical protein
MKQEEYLEGIYRIHPEIIIDMMASPESVGGTFYDKWDFRTRQPGTMTREKILEYAIEFKTMAILLPPDMVTTRLVSYLKDADPDEAIQSKLSYDLSSCIYNSMECGVVGDRGFALVSAIPDFTAEALGEILAPLQKRGVSIIRVMDRRIVLTNYIAGAVAPSGNCFCLEQRGDAITMWTAARIGERLVPVNSNCFKLPAIAPVNTLENQILVLKSEFDRIHKFPSPDEAVILVDGRPILGGMWDSDRLKDICGKALGLPDVRVATVPNGGVLGMVMTEQYLEEAAHV